WHPGDLTSFLKSARELTDYFQPVKVARHDYH
ncbi:unnamed protein product, partial [marine sediment metagenome]